MKSLPAYTTVICGALISGALASTLTFGCAILSTPGNENGVSLDQAIAAIIADIDRSRECGDSTTPALTAEQLEQALISEFDKTDGQTTFEDYLLEQAQIFKDRADEQCDLTGTDNTNENASTPDDPDDNSNTA